MGNYLVVARTGRGPVPVPATEVQMKPQTKLLDEWFAYETSARALKAHIDYCRITGQFVSDEMNKLYREQRELADALKFAIQGTT